MRPARSVMVVSHTSATWGAQRRLLDVAPRLVDHGFVSTLAAPAGDLSEAWRGLGLPFEALDLPPQHGVRDADGGRPGPRALAREVVAQVRSVAAIAARVRPHSLVQSHSLYAHLETALAGRVARRPVVVDLHDIVSPGLGRRLLRTATELATITVANSGATADVVGGIAQGRVLVVHPGVDLDRFRPAPADPDLRRALTVDPEAPLVAILGRVDPEKGVDTLVEAMARLAHLDPRPCLAVVGRELFGSATWVDDLRTRAHELLGDRVRFVGPSDAPDEVLRSVDVLVNASDSEPFGRTILEAQATGVPVVATAAGGVTEFVADGDTGLLVPPRDERALADALERVLADGELRRRLARGGRSQAETLFSLDRQAAKVAEVYRLTLGDL